MRMGQRLPLRLLLELRSPWLEGARCALVPGRSCPGQGRGQEQKKHRRGLHVVGKGGLIRADVVRS